MAHICIYIYVYIHILCESPFLAGWLLSRVRKGCEFLTFPRFWSLGARSQRTK